MCTGISKKAVSLILAIAMTLSIATTPMLSANAAKATSENPWKDSVPWPSLTAKNSSLAPDAVKFTHKEYTGNGSYQDPITKETVRACDVVGVNREDPHTNAAVPYATVESALTGAANYEKENSDYVQMLTTKDSNWELTVAQNAAQGQKFLDGRFMDSGYQEAPEDGWKKVSLPCSWDCQGFQHPLFTNITYPWQTKYDPNVTVPNAPVNYNPVGFYRTKFTVKDTMLQENGRVFINFGGVESAYYVYVNGYEVGYSEDSYSEHEFDITDYLNPKGEENTLAVEVHLFSDGTWFEDQDMVNDGGIFRDVYIKSVPLVSINDYRVITDLDDTYTDANLELTTKVKNYSDSDVSNYAIDVKLFDEDGENIFENNPMRFDVSAIRSGETAEDSISKLVKNPKLWSAEHPNLYTMVLSLYDKTTGRYFESTSQELGFREINFTRTIVDQNYKNITPHYQTVTINGKPLLFKGVDRHDTDPFYGKHVPKQTAEEDVKLMKQYNVNAIRTSHYTDDEYLYYLADKYGLYILGETNLEDHGINYDPNIAATYLADMAMDREVTAFNTLKNRTSIVMWSIGNECGYTVSGGNYFYPKLIKYFKDQDATRPVHSEAQQTEGGVDVYSSMYPLVSEVQSRGHLANNMPYVMCEYNHAKGNSIGNMKEYWDAVRDPTSTSQMGGFIWDWVDQSRATSFDVLPENKNITEKSSNAVVGTVNGDGKVTDVSSESGSLTGAAYNNYTLMPSSSNSLYNSVLSGGDKAFTIEAVVKPSSKKAENLMISKGDRQMSLKTTSTGLEFFMYDGKWNEPVVTPYPSDWVGNWHQVVGTYDPTNGISLYCDGVLQGHLAGKYTTSSSATHLGVGYDESTGRSFDGLISLARIYNKALTPGEINAQRSATPAIQPKDPSVVTWLDYSAEITTSPTSTWDYFAEDYAHQNLYKDEMEGHYFSWGGDWGDNPNDNTGCDDGLLSPDRTPQPELNQVKYEYQNFWFKATTNDVMNRRVSVYNENNFTDLNEYDLTWELVADGKTIDQGSMSDIDVAPKKTKALSIPYTMPAVSERKAGTEYYLNINVVLKEDKFFADAGYEVAHQQFKVPATVPAVPPQISDKTVTIDQNSDTDNILVKGEKFSFKLSKATGAMSNYVYGGKELITQGPVPDFWRCKLENDQAIDGTWQDANKNITIAPSNGITVTTSADGRQVITTNLILNNAKGATETVIYTIDGSGAITISLSLDATKTTMGTIMKVGSTMTLPRGYENFNWYGLGPVESFQDRKESNVTGLFSSTVNEMFFPFNPTQTSGNLVDVKWASLTSDSSDTGILVAAKDLMETSAQHSTMDELQEAHHTYEIKPHEETYFNVDYKSRGTGNNSCGPDNLPQYTIPNNKVYSYEYTIIPFDKTQDQMELSKPWRTMELFNQDDFDKEQAAYVQKEIADLFLYSYDQLGTLQKCEEDYNSLSDAQKALVTNYDKLQQALIDIERLKDQSAYIIDKSSNKLDPVLGSTASLKGDNAFGRALHGYLAVPNTKGTNGGDIFADVFKGKKPFTVETWVKPGEYSDFNMFMSKGDNCFGFRSRPNTTGFYDMQFYIKAGSNWITAESSKIAQADWLNNWHQVAGIYDGTNVQIYLDGNIVGTKPDTSADGVASNSANFCVGIDAETNRTNNNDFALSRVYSKALTAADLQAQAEYDKDSTKAPAYAPDNKNVVLWLDYKNSAPNIVTKVAVTPDTATVRKGGTQQFNASVYGIGGFSKDVIWSVNSNKSKIDSAGLLTVAGNETASSLKVTATSAVDPSQFATAAVTVNSGSTADKSALQTAIAAAKEFSTETDSGKYTSDSWAVFQDAIKAAQSVFDNLTATAEQVTKALADLEAAQGGLELKSIKNAEDRIDNLPDPKSTTNLTEAQKDSVKAAAEQVTGLTADEKLALDPAKVEKLEELLEKTATLNKTVSTSEISDEQRQVKNPILSNLLLAAGITGGENNNPNVNFEFKQLSQGTNPGAAIVLELTLTNNGAAVHELKFPVTVSFTLPSKFDSTKNYIVIHHKNDGTVEELPLTISNGIGSFATTSFSKFEIAQGSITLDKTALALTNSNTIGQLTATVSPANAADKTVVWSSSNASVAIVDANGKVTAKSNGSAIITAKTQNGAYLATCTVTVTGFSSGSGSHSDSHSGSGSVSSAVVTPSASTFISDTTTDFNVSGAYQFKITSTNGQVPTLAVGTSGVFSAQLVITVGNDYYFKLTAIGTPGAKAGIYVNGTKLLVATVGATASTVKSDTTRPFTVRTGASYVFKLTANAKPTFAAGTSSAFKVEFVKAVGMDYFFRVTAVGKAGAASGFYINSQKQPVTVATIVK